MDTKGGQQLLYKHEGRGDLCWSFLRYILGESEAFTCRAGIEEIDGGLGVAAQRSNAGCPARVPMQDVG